VTAGSSRPVILIAGAWFVIALAVGASGAIGRLRPPGPQLVLIGLTLVLLALGQWMPAVRDWRRSVDLRAFPALHLGRLVAGGTFLLLVARGRIPDSFIPAGVGDSLVALLALALIVFVRPDQPGARKLYLAWNVLGLVDILLVVATATRIGLRNPDAIAGFGTLPLALLPTFYVPIVLATHVWLFMRLARARAGVPSQHRL
jgi:hypothetical protein